MTSALLVGQAGDKKAPPPAATPAPVASSCGSDCGCNGGHRFRDRFHSRDCCDSAPTACHTRERQPLFHSRCGDACSSRSWSWHREPKCCETKPACNNDCCERQGFLSRLRERFHRDRCCDTGCATTTSSPPPKKIEKIDTPPKKLEKGKEGEVFETRSAPNAIQVTPTAPAVEIVPVPPPAPRIEGGRRDPF
jgi:hypothetical protein